MFKTFVNIFKNKGLRNKILFSAVVIIVWQIVANIPCPSVNTMNLKIYFDKLSQEPASNFLFSGDALQLFVIGSLGIMPYIFASIIMKLLISVLPSLNRLKREGEAGMNKVNQYTRCITILICIIHGAITAFAITHPERLDALQRAFSGNLS